MSVLTRILADGQSVTVERVQDVEPIIERNKILQTIPQQSDWGRHVASVPNVLLEKWLNEENARGNPVEWGTEEFYSMVERKLQDPDYRYLRTDGVSNAFLGFGS